MTDTIVKKNNKKAPKEQAQEIQKTAPSVATIEQLEELKKHINGNYHHN